MKLHQVTIGITYTIDTDNGLDALAALAKVSAFLSDVRGRGIEVDCQVEVTPAGMLNAALQKAIDEVNG